MRSVGAVHKFAQTPLRAQRRAVVRASRNTPAIEAKQFKVALLGAAGGIGQPLALLLKMNKLVSELSLYDVANVVGVAADLSHCNTPVKVKHHVDLNSQAAIQSYLTQRVLSLLNVVPHIKAIIFLGYRMLSNLTQDLPRIVCRSQVMKKMICQLP